MPHQIKVWDIAVRSFHWLLVAFFFIAYLTGDDSVIHAYAGYVVLALVAFRLIWGIIGTRYARFSNFVYSKQTVKTYVRSILDFRPIHYIGHNPLGGWMVIFLLIFLLLTSWTGLEAYAAEGKGPLAALSLDLNPIGIAWADSDHNGHSLWESVHEFFANFTLFLVFVHIAGVLFSSVIHGENLIKSMITGEKTLSEKETSNTDD
ncbi:cytochrome b/b6 domain-containing protein [Hydrogenovibrio kuenenii]|uniref:cytochrome b/b6 domain-containing protein n=1 Tax=Hydrogenovibrio kuenenii TaxID=63658 RepID=UPI000466A210|nr:cytochrome b/b6 domain-containing protein [Hydrogenovibrio kuenenii]